MIVKRRRGSAAFRLEALETRTLFSVDGWQEYALNPQHTALSTVASQPLDGILWQTPVDLDPQYSGSDLLIHYGSPLITAANTMILPVKTGASGGFEIQARSGYTGALEWTQTSNYVLPPSGGTNGWDWTPNYSPTLTPSNGLYYAGIGGTVNYISTPDASGPAPPPSTVLSFSSAYGANQAAYNSSVFINTPITTDANGDIFFGFIVTSTTLGITSGIARIDANGTGSYVPVVAGMSQVATNSAPALSNDGNTLYVLESTGNWGNGKLVALNSHTLAVTAQVALVDPHTGDPADITNDATAAPMVGPDGQVYIGVLENPFASNNDRGWLLQFNSNLSTEGTPGAFGWDDTPSVVPASMVPSYHGTSTYLLMTKYNNYAGLGSGTGDNKIAILDPNATEVDPVTGATVMKEVETIEGPTPDPNNDGKYPGAVREWCINDAVVDPATDSVLVNSEDGKLYRWNLASNTFTQDVVLTSGVGEAYTPTLIGPDGTVYAINNAILFAVGDTQTATLKLTGYPTSVTAGATNNLTVSAYNAEGDLIKGYTGTVQFSSSDPLATLPSNYMFTTNDAGTHVFPVTLMTGGAQSITVTDVATPTITGSVSTTVTSASLIQQDTTTQGNWIGKYGADGYNIIGDATNYPSYATVTPTGESTTVWSSSTTDPRALENPGGTGRIAATWYSSTSFSINVDLTDGKSHDVALYALNWDNLARDEQIQITSATTGAVLDTETLSSFTGGVYLQWMISGDVVITVTNLGHPNAVISGLFFDPTVVPPATATFVQQDTTTQGNWINKYGSDGYNVIGDAASYPSYAKVTPIGESTTIWSSSTTDPRALENPGGSGRIAATWYASTSFSINVDLTDGKTHDVALYALNWDNLARDEQIQITSATTGAVLDTESVSSFTGGVYLQWAISGDVVITVTNLGHPNAVISGLFFDPTAAPPPAMATFVQQDTTTQGNWIGKYGTDGYNVIGDATGYPSYATVTPTGESTTIWSSSTTDPRALENPGGSGRIAATWYASTSFSINVDLTDGKAHDVALYALNWDNLARDEQIQITSATTGAVLDTESISSFTGGVYLQWKISGDVVITVTNLGHPNAVISGLFFDPTVVPPATATFVQKDTTTQGNWIGKYGSDGYNVIGDTTGYPSYATVTPSGEGTTVWSSSTTDPRALENPGGSGRIAATWYSSTSFSINVNLTDGQAHDVTLYALDWDNRARSEQIQITSAITGTVLDTETISNFSGGVYLEWTISGNVVIKVTNQASPNAVISGLFFDPS